MNNTTVFNMKRKTTDSGNGETEFKIENKEKKLRYYCGTNHEKLTKRQDPNANNLIEEIEKEEFKNTDIENKESEFEYVKSEEYKTEEIENEKQDPNSNNLIEEIEKEGIDNKTLENEGSETKESENEDIGKEKIRYECRACDATFAQKQGLDRHVDSVHLG